MGEVRPEDDRPGAAGAAEVDLDLNAALVGGKIDRGGEDPVPWRRARVELRRLEVGDQGGLLGGVQPECAAERPKYPAQTYDARRDLS